MVLLTVSRFVLASAVLTIVAFSLSPGNAKIVAPASESHPPGPIVVEIPASRQSTKVNVDAVLIGVLRRTAGERTSAIAEGIPAQAIDVVDGELLFWNPSFEGIRSVRRRQ
jgi:hypothetical protein